MNIFIKKSDTNSYSFTIFEEKGDSPGMGYQSELDFYLVSGIKSHYPTYTEAHSAALRIAEKHPEVVMAKKAAFSLNSINKENDLTTSFFYFWNSFITETKTKPADFHLHGASASRVFGMLKTGSKSPIIECCAEYSEAEIEENEKEGVLDCLRFFAETAAAALNPANEKIHIKKAEYIPNSDSYDIVLGDDKGDVCCLKIDNKLLLEDVLPCGNTTIEKPYHSTEFFETYFEPVMAAIGHIKVKEVVALVNHSKSTRRKILAFSTVDNSPKLVKVSIPKSKDSVWGFKIEPLPARTASLEGKQIRCTRPDLPTYYERTGTVTEEINRGVYNDIVVDFGRGLGLVVMTDSDVTQI